MGVFHHLDHLGHGKKADEGRDDGDAGRQGFVEDEPPFPGHVAFADTGQQQAQCAAEKALEHGTGRKTGDDGDAEDRRPEQLGRTELHGEFGHGRRKEDQGERPHDPADKG